MMTEENINEIVEKIKSEIKDSLKKEIVEDISKETENLKKTISDLTNKVSKIDTLEKQIGYLTYSTEPVRKEKQIEDIVKGLLTFKPEEINMVLNKNPELKKKFLDYIGEVEI